MYFIFLEKYKEIFICSYFSVQLEKNVLNCIKISSFNYHMFLSSVCKSAYRKWRNRKFYKFNCKGRKFCNSSACHCSETNVMHFLFNLLRIKGLYMYRALLTHPQEALHKRHFVYCVRVMSVGCYQYWSGVMLHSSTGSSGHLMHKQV
jgi:hypothetical protein